MSLHHSCGMEKTGRIQCNREGAGLISPETGETWVTEATSERSCAKLENSCHNVTGCPGGSGSKGTNQEGKCLSDLSSSLAVTVTICLHTRWSPLQNSWQLTNPAQASRHVVENHCRAACPPAKHSRPRGARSEGRVVSEGQQLELPHPAVPSSSRAGGHRSYCKNSLSKTTQLNNK